MTFPWPGLREQSLLSLGMAGHDLCASGKYDIGERDSCVTYGGDRNLHAFNSSRAALNSITIEYAKELRGPPININASDPGQETLV